MNRVMKERHRRQKDAAAEEEETEFGLLVASTDVVSTNSLPSLTDGSVDNLDYCPVVGDDDDTDGDSTAAASPACLASLCLCMLTHSYLLISVFPYSGFMVIHLIESVNEENAGSYAGLLASAFMLGRATTGYMWGKVADTYGRTTVLHLSLGAACILSIGFGLAPTFASAIALRFCLGAWNGIMGTVKTVASDIAKGNEKVEIQAMQLIIGMWAWGFLISPVISGALAEPIRQYPQWEWLQNNNTVLTSILSRHPFLLPNLFGSVLCLVAILAVWTFVPEPVPEEKRRSVKYLMTDFWESCWSCLPSNCCTCCTRLGPYQSIPVQHLHEIDGSCHVVDSPRAVIKSSPTVTVTDSSSASVATIFARKQTRTTLLVYWLCSFISSSLDEIFSLFCISHRAGLGLDEIHIGQVLSVCGLVFACSQYFIYPLIYNRFGLYGAIRVGSMFSFPVMILVPLSVLLNQGAAKGELLPVTFAFLAIVIAIGKLFALVLFSSISVAVNQSVPFEHRGTVNGLSVQGGSIANGLGPTFAGLLVTVSVSVLGKAGSLLIFGTVAMLGVIATALVFAYVQEVNNKSLVGDGDNDIGHPVRVVGGGCDKASESIELTKNDSLRHRDHDSENR